MEEEEKVDVELEAMASAMVASAAEGVHGGSCAVEQVFGVIALMHARACMLSNGVLLGRHLKYTILSSSVHFLRQ